MVIDIKNKKGDVTISTVIWIVLGVAVLVMMIIGFTKGWGFFFDWFDKGPSDLQTIAKACGVYIQGGLTIDFCSYRVAKIDGNDEILNCEHPLVTEALKADNVLSTIKCSNVNNNLGTVCASVGNNNNTIKVNNVAGNCLKEPVITITG